MSKKLKIVVINGPNLNLLGKRDMKKYGIVTLEQINNKLLKIAKENNCNLVFFQANCEGKIIDFLQKKASRNCDGILINPGALTHYGYSLRDALEDTKLPIVEVHLTDIEKRESFRKIDVLQGLVVERVMGYKQQSYYLAIQKLIDHIQKKL